MKSICYFKCNNEYLKRMTITALQSAILRKIFDYDTITVIMRTTKDIDHSTTDVKIYFSTNKTYEKLFSQKFNVNISVRKKKKLCNY